MPKPNYRIAALLFAAAFGLIIAGVGLATGIAGGMVIAGVLLAIWTVLFVLEVGR